MILRQRQRLFSFLLAAVIVFVFGPGAFSLDWIIAKIYRKKMKAAGTPGSAG